MFSENAEKNYNTLYENKLHSKKKKNYKALMLNSLCSIRKHCKTDYENHHKRNSLIIEMSQTKKIKTHSSVY